MTPGPPQDSSGCSSASQEPSPLWAQDNEPLTHVSPSLSQALDFHKVASRGNQIKSFLGRMEAVKRLDKLNENLHIMQIQQGQIKKKKLVNKISA